MTRKIKMLLALLVLSAMAGVVTSVAHAAGSDPTAPVTSPRTAFDPFRLTTYAVRSRSTGTPIEVSGQVASRRPIRIPFRPRLRSPFRPQWGPQAW